MSKYIRKIIRSHLVRSTWRRVIHLWKPMAGWTLLVWAIIAVILVPISSAVLGLQFFRSGNLVIGNEELLSWMFSPMGLGYILLGASLALTGWILRFTGIFQIVTNDIYDKPVNLRDILVRIISRIHILFRLCLFIVATGLLLFLPLAAGLGLIYELFLDTYDINYYLSTSPLEWHIAIIVAILWLILWLLGTLYIIARSLFALPAYLHSQKSIRESIVYAWKRGHQKSKSNLKSILSAIGFWLLIRLLANAFIFAVSIEIINWISGSFESVRIVALATGIYIMISISVDAIISFLGFSYVSTLITKLYFRDFRDLKPLPLSRNKFKKLASFLWGMLQPKRLSIAIIIVLLISFFLSGFILEQIPQPDSEKNIDIIAHRAGPPPAPENTLAALNLTLQTEAEFAEIDVQLSQDSVVVVAHDFDLMRTANNPARIAETNFAKLQDILSKEHSENKEQLSIHTFDEFLAASQGKIELIVELKRSNAALAQRVVKAIQQKSMENEVTILSMNLGVIRQIQNIAPKLTVGYLSTFTLGNINQLPVELLAVNYRSITNRFITDARNQGLKIYAWTVNRADIMTNMIEHDVDGIITDDPELGIQVRNEIQELTAAERLLLQFHQLIKAEMR